MTDGYTDIDVNRLQELEELFDTIGLGSDNERGNFLQFYFERETNDYSKYLKTTTVTARNR